MSNAGLVHITRAGTCIVVASQAGKTAYLAAPDKGHTITISQAATTTAATCGADSTITPCSASVSGPGGLNQSLTVSYQNNTNAGTATANASHSPPANLRQASR